MTWSQQDVPDREWAAYLRMAELTDEIDDHEAYEAVVKYEVAREREACAAECDRRGRMCAEAAKVEQRWEPKAREAEQCARAIRGRS